MLKTELQKSWVAIPIPSGGSPLGTGGVACATQWSGCRYFGVQVENSPVVWIVERAADGDRPRSGQTDPQSISLPA
jgi:hypothetical protein